MTSIPRAETILATTTELLTESGWEQLTMRAVAERAGASLSTIYDRWPTKTDLALAAIRSVTDAQDWSLESISELLAERPNIVLCLLSIQRSGPAHRHVIRDQFLEPMLGPLRDSIIELTRGGLDQDTAMLVALIGPALLFARAIFLEEPITPAELSKIANLIDEFARISAGPGQPETDTLR